MGERFSIMRCAGCGLVRTEPQPDHLERFYPSESYYSYAAPELPALTRAVVHRAYGLPHRGGWLFRLAVPLATRRLGGIPPPPAGDLWTWAAARARSS